MHKPVRYYITESNDQPVVRSVQLATRIEPETETAVATAPEIGHEIKSRFTRRSLTRKLKPHRSNPARS